MLKFFRKYNKFILAFGAAFLMLAFLIQPTLSVFMRGGEDQPIGYVDGQKITLGDQQAAAVELQTLERLHPALSMLAQGISEGDPLKWVLMKVDAERMGINASDVEVDALLQSLGHDETSLRQLSMSMRAPTGYFQQVLRNWLIVEQYREIVLGQTHVPAIRRLQALTFLTQAQQMGDWQLMMQAYEMAEQAFGHPRLSEPLIRHMLRDIQTTVGGEVALIEAERYLDDVEPPSEAEMQALFEQYRDVPPGEGEPYGFGYRIPARVKIEYLAVPIERVRREIEIEEADALAYYEQNSDRYRNSQDDIEDGAPEIQPYSEVWRQVHRDLRDRKARELADRIVRAGQAMLVQDARQLEQSAGYRVVPDDYQPPSLSDLADRLESQFGVRPERYDDFAGEWMNVADLGALPGLGRSTLAGRPDIGFQQYVRSAFELEPADDDPLVGLGLQVLMPSQPLEGEEGSRYLFRLVDAQPAQAPASLDQVAEQVRRDAHRRKAYEQALLPSRDEWLSRARSEGLDALAEAEALTQVPLPSIPRREADAQGRLTAPSVPGVGRSEALVDGMFEIAEAVSGDGETAVENVDEAERIGAAEVDVRLSLALYRVDEYQPVTENQYRQMVQQPRVVSWVSQMIGAGDAGATESLSQQAVRTRVNFEPADREEAEGNDVPRQPQRRPGQI